MIPTPPALQHTLPQSSLWAKASCMSLQMPLSGSCQQWVEVELVEVEHTGIGSERLPPCVGDMCHDAMA